MLKLSTKGRYAVRIMVFLAAQRGDAPSRKQDIAEAEAISPDYVEQILMRLRAGGLVTSHRGARGGFTLARDPRKMTVMDVLAATEGPVEMAPCDDAQCLRESVCVASKVWKEAETAVTAIFSKAVIAELASRVNALKADKQISYDI